MMLAVNLVGAQTPKIGRGRLCLMDYSAEKT